MEKGKIIELNYIRGISCLMVMLFHYTTRYTEMIGNAEFPIKLSFGYMAVSAFFLLSGFLSLYNSKNEFSLSSFLKKRFIRLYPVYWACMTFTAIVCLIMLPKFAVTIKEYIINLTMFPEVLKVPYIDGAYWSLMREIIFYVILGVILKIRAKKFIPVISMIWICLLIVLHFVNIYYQNLIITGLKYALIVQYAQHFITGMLLYFILTAEKIKDYIIIGIDLILCIVYNFLEKGIYYTVFFVILTTVMTVIVLNAKYKFWTLSKGVITVLKPLSFLAAISYPVYLIHQNFGYAIINCFANIGITNEFILLIPVILSIFLGWILNKFIEKPVTGLLTKRLIKR